MKLRNLIHIALVLAWFGPGQTAQAVSPPPDGGYPGSVTPPSGYAIDGDLGPTLPGDWVVVGVSDFNRDGHRDYALFNPTTRLTAIWYLSGETLRGAFGPSVPDGWQLRTTADFNGDGKPDYVLYNADTHQTAIWYLNYWNTAIIDADFGPTLPSGWDLVGVSDFNRDGHADYALFNPTTRLTAIWYLSGGTLLRGAFGPSVPDGWQLLTTADFNGDGKPDYVLFNATTHQTVICYLNYWNTAIIDADLGPTLPSDWDLVGVSDFNRDGHGDYVLFNPTTRLTATWYLPNNANTGAANGQLSQLPGARSR